MDHPVSWYASVIIFVTRPPSMSSVTTANNAKQHIRDGLLFLVTHTDVVVSYEMTSFS